MESKLEKLKEVMRNGMIENFKRDGFLTPIFFMYKDGKPYIAPIPSSLLNTLEGKMEFADYIRDTCSEPNVLAAGIIIEAYGAVLNNDMNSDSIKKLESGELRVSNLDDKEDIILMIFSTPEKDEMISHIVNCKNKEVKDEFLDNEYTKSIGGIFSNFFNWTKN